MPTIEQVEAQCMEACERVIAAGKKVASGDYDMLGRVCLIGALAAGSRDYYRVAAAELGASVRDVQQLESGFEDWDTLGDAASEFYKLGAKIRQIFAPRNP